MDSTKPGQDHGRGEMDSGQNHSKSDTYPNYHPNQLKRVLKQLNNRWI